MTRYYDPVTHRFLNADGYYQSGGGLLDTNMNAYCANNPVNAVDSNGTCYVRSDKGSKWMVTGHVPGADYYCYKCGQCDPSYRPSYSPKKPEPTILEKIEQTAVVIITSPQVDFGAGYGLGATVAFLYDIGLDFVISADLIHIKLSREGFDIGSELHAAAGFSAGPAYAGWDETYWQSWINGPVTTYGPKTNIDIVNAGLYCLIGGQVVVSIDTDYIAKGVAEIWS